MSTTHHLTITTLGADVSTEAVVAALTAAIGATITDDDTEPFRLATIEVAEPPANGSPIRNGRADGTPITVELDTQPGGSTHLHFRIGSRHLGVPIGPRAEPGAAVEGLRTLAEALAPDEPMPWHAPKPLTWEGPIEGQLSAGPLVGQCSMEAYAWRDDPSEVEAYMLRDDRGDFWLHTDAEVPGWGWGPTVTRMTGPSDDPGLPVAPDRLVAPR